MTAPAASRGRRGLRKAWPWIKFVVAIGLAVLAVQALTGRKGELSGAATYLDHVSWWWVAVAAAAEAGSLVAFALIQKSLFDAAHVPVTTGQMFGVTVAATAIANSMPAGPIVSSVFAFSQYRRRGADDALAGWMLVAVFVAASVSLAVFASVGLAVAGGEGNNLNLLGVTLAVLVLSLLVGAVFVQRRFLAWSVRKALLATRRVVGWPKGDVAQAIQHVVDRVTSVTLDWKAVSRITGWAVANWALDCGCLVVAFLAVHVGVPWKGLFLAYGAGQLAANLPITPGGLGVVEGSLTIALVAFGGAETSTVAAVLLYRILSFWAELPIGWATWAAIAWATRRERRQATAGAESNEVAGVMA